jgi:hypothetical protein
MQTQMIAAVRGRHPRAATRVRPRRTGPRRAGSHRTGFRWDGS